MAQTLVQLIALLRYCITGHPPPPFTQTGPPGEITGVQPRRDASRLVSIGKHLREKYCDDPVDAFIEVLIDAVDRHAAREDMEKRLDEADDGISDARKTIDEFSCRIKFYNDRVATIPDLSFAIEEDTQEVEELQSYMNELEEERALLKRRLAQSKHELSTLLNKLYNAVPSYLDALDDRQALRGTVVPKKFTASLRNASQCAEIIEATRERVKVARQEYAEAARTGTERDQKFSALLSTEKLLSIQRENQYQREDNLLSESAPLFLTGSGLMAAPRRISESSSSSGVVSFRDHRDGRWTGRCGPLEDIDDGVQNDTGAVRAWREERAALAFQRKRLKDTQEIYARHLAGHLFVYPNSTQDVFDAIVTNVTGVEHHTNEAQEINALQVKEADYSRIRQQAKAAQVQDQPLSPDWATSANDVAPSQGDSFIHRLERTDIDARDRAIRRWNRHVTRRKPFGEAGGRLPAPPVLSPAKFRAMRSPSIRPGSPGAVGSCVSPRSRNRRIRHMSAVGKYLRQQFEMVGGPQYLRDVRGTLSV